MIREGNYIYNWCETGEWIVCGKVKVGLDGDYIQWLP